MRIIPVLDVLDRQVVRGIAGQRESYQPIQSQLTSDSDAASIAQAFRDVFGLTEFYVADLDGIERGAPNFETLQTLQQSQANLWLDVGTNSRASLQQLAQHIPLNSVHRIIVGLEGCPDLSVLESIQSMVSPDQLAFSLDLNQGTPLLPAHASEAWANATAWEIAQQVLEFGVASLIVLDLAAVGMGSGTPTQLLCSTIRDSYPELELITGGGIRDVEDLQQLEEVGCEGVLIASALHDGRLTVKDLNPYL